MNNSDKNWENLAKKLKQPQDHFRVEFGLELRVLARLKEQKEYSWTLLAWRWFPYFGCGILMLVAALLPAISSLSFPSLVASDNLTLSPAYYYLFTLK